MNKGLKFNNLLPKVIKENAGEERDKLQDKYLDRIECFIQYINNEYQQDAFQFQKALENLLDEITDYHNVISNIGYKIKTKSKLERVIKLLYSFLCSETRQYVSYALQKRFLETIFDMFATKIRLMVNDGTLKLNVEPIIDRYMEWVRDHAHGAAWLTARMLTDTQAKLGKRFKLLYRQAIQLISPFYTIEGTKEGYFEKLQEKFSWMLNLACGDKEIMRIQILFLNCINPSVLRAGNIDAVIEQWQQRRAGFGKLHSILLKPTVKPVPQGKKKTNLQQEWDKVHWRFLCNIARQINELPPLEESTNSFLLSNILEVQQLATPSIAMQGKSVAYGHASPSYEVLNQIGTFLGRFQPNFVHRLLTVFTAFSLSNKDNTVQLYCLLAMVEEMARRKKYSNATENKDLKSSKALDSECTKRVILSIIGIIEKQYQTSSMGMIFNIQSILNYILYLDTNLVLVTMTPKLIPLLQKFVLEQSKPTELMMGIGIVSTFLSHTSPSDFDLSSFIGPQLIANLLQHVNLNNSILSGILIRFLCTYLLHVDSLEDEVTIEGSLDMLLTILGTAEGDDHVSSMNTDNISFGDEKDAQNSFFSDIQAQLLRGLGNFTKILLSKIVDESIFDDLIQKKLLQFIKSEYKPTSVKAISPLLREASKYNEKAYKAFSKELLNQAKQALDQQNNRSKYYLNLFTAIQTSNPHVSETSLDDVQELFNRVEKLDVKENEGLFSAVGSLISATLLSLQEILPYHYHKSHSSRFVTYSDVQIEWRTPNSSIIQRIFSFYEQVVQQILKLPVEKGTIGMIKGVIGGVRYLQTREGINNAWMAPFVKLENVTMKPTTLTPSFEEIQQFYQKVENDDLQESIVELYKIMLTSDEKFQDFSRERIFLYTLHLEKLCPRGQYIPYVHIVNVTQNMRIRHFINHIHVHRQPAKYAQSIVKDIYALSFSDLSIQNKAKSTMNCCVDNYNDTFAAHLSQQLLESLSSLHQSASDQTICRLIDYMGSKESFLLELTYSSSHSQTLFDLVFKRLVHDEKSMIQMKVNQLIKAFVSNWHSHFEGNRVFKVVDTHVNILNTLLTYRQKEMPLSYESHLSLLIRLYMKAMTLSKKNKIEESTLSLYLNQKLVDLIGIPNIWDVEIYTLLCTTTTIAPKLVYHIKIEEPNAKTIPLSSFTYAPLEGTSPDVRTINYCIQPTQTYQKVITLPFIEKLLSGIMEGFDRKHGLKQFVRISTLVANFYRMYPEPQIFLNYMNNVLDTKLKEDTNEEEENKAIFHIGTLLSGIHFGLCGMENTAHVEHTTKSILSPILFKLLQGNYENASQVLRFVVVALSRLRGPTDWLVEVLYKLSKETKSTSVFQRTRSLLFLSYPFQLHRRQNKSWYDMIEYPHQFEDTSTYHLDRSLQAMFHAMYYGIHRVGNNKEFEKYYDLLLSKGQHNALEFDKLLCFICFLSDASLITSNSFIQSVIFEKSRLKLLVQQLFNFLKDVKEETSGSPPPPLNEDKMNLNDLTYYTVMTLTRLFSEGDRLPEHLLTSTIDTLLELIHYSNSPLSSSRERMKIVIFLGSVLFRHADSPQIAGMIDRLFNDYFPVEKSLMVLENLSDLLTLCLSLVPKSECETFATLVIPRVSKLKSPKVYFLYVLRSIIQTFPATLPSFVSKALVVLATFESRTKYQAIVNQTFASFWKNHQSQWAIHASSLSADDRDTIEQITAGYSYYA